jgi:hypothetical protein
MADPETSGRARWTAEAALERREQQQRQQQQQALLDRWKASRQSDYFFDPTQLESGAVESTYPMMLAAAGGGAPRAGSLISMAIRKALEREPGPSFQVMKSDIRRRPGQGYGVLHRQRQPVGRIGELDRQAARQEGYFKPYEGQTASSRVAYQQRLEQEVERLLAEYGVGRSPMELIAKQEAERQATLEGAAALERMRAVGP